jgi:hypothetical protein
MGNSTFRWTVLAPARIVCRMILQGPAGPQSFVRLGRDSTRCIPLDRLRLQDFDEALPWRVFRSRRGQAHLSGSYWAATTGGHVVYESRLELARLLLADFDRAVSSIRAQPFRFVATAAETGYSRKLLAECARQAGITLATARQTTPIDQAWLREQYLKRKRSFPDIANGLDVSEMTVIRAAHRYGIPVRLAGVASSHQTMIQTHGKSLPRDIRCAVEGARYGWQRLHRFEITMSFPTIEQAAAYLGAHQSALVKQLQRLETDIGTQLFHRSTQSRPARPTRRGTTLLKKLARPDIRSLISQHNHAEEQGQR